VKSVLLTGAFRFPDRDAGAFRMLSVADLFSKLGWKVTVAGWETADRSPYWLGEYECFPQGEFREKALDPVRRLKGFIGLGHRTLEWIEKRPRFDVVVAYNPPALFAARLLEMCRTRNTVAVLDSTEWFDGSHLPGGRIGPAAFENWCRMRVVYPRFHNVICISTMLERYFAGRNVVRVPPLRANLLEEVPITKPDFSEGVRLVYAGQAGKKDRLAIVLAALPAISSALGLPVRLSLAGMEHAELYALLKGEGLDTEVPASVDCLGRISRQAVGALYGESHFSLLFRSNRRYALAGFPTKAVESWGHGCPIICNPIGDLARIATDGRHVLFVEERDLETRLPEILRTMISEGTYPSMVAACRKKVDEEFTSDAYRSSFERFAERLFNRPRSVPSGTV
jgi:glycosyltransferase involved in cell wall biosynthesis